MRVQNPPSSSKAYAPTARSAIPFPSRSSRDATDLPKRLSSPTVPLNPPETALIFCRLTTSPGSADAGFSINETEMTTKAHGRRSEERLLIVIYWIVGGCRSAFTETIHCEIFSSRRITLPRRTTQIWTSGGEPVDVPWCFRRPKHRRRNMSKVNQEGQKTVT